SGTYTLSLHDALPIWWIGVEPPYWATSLRAQAGRLPPGLSSRDSCRIRRDRSSLNKGVATATGASLSYGENWHAIHWPPVYRNRSEEHTSELQSLRHL